MTVDILKSQSIDNNYCKTKDKSIIKMSIFYNPCRCIQARHTAILDSRADVLTISKISNLKIWTETFYSTRLGLILNMANDRSPKV